MPQESDLVILAGRRTEQAVHLDVLRDWSALGLVADFIWVDTDSEPGLKGTACLSVSGGRVRPGRLADELARRAITGSAHLACISHMGDNFSTVGADRALLLRHEVEKALPAAEVTALQVIGVAHHEDYIPVPATQVAWLGAHNVVLAPENAQSPRAGVVPVVGEPANPVAHTHLAAGVCSATGLWTADRHTPFHGAPDGGGARLVALRTYTRHLSAQAVEHWLAARAMDVSGGYPAPMHQGSPARRIDDQAGAAARMADQLLARHEHVLVSGRAAAAPVSRAGVGLGQAIPMMLRFFGSSLAGSPRAFMDGLVEPDASMPAVQPLGHDSAWLVTARGIRGVRPDGTLATTEQLDGEIGALIGDLQGLPGAVPPEHPDHSALWTDFVDGALTLLDGQRRNEDLQPQEIGGVPGVVTSPLAVAPPPADTFEVAASVSGYARTSRVEACDIDGAQRTDALLAELATQHEHVADQLGAERGRLRDWSATQTQSYAGRVGGRLFEAITRTRQDVVSMAEELKGTGGGSDAHAAVAADQSTLARTLVRVTGAFGLGMVALLLGAGLGWLGWGFAMPGVLVLGVLWLLVATVVFVQGQRGLFDLVHRREAAAARVEAIRRDLPLALADLRGLQHTYRQYLDWAHALGAFVQAPWGSHDFAADAVDELGSGYPHNHRFGVAVIDPDEVEATEAAAARLRHDLVPLGWTTQAWQAFVTDLPSIGADTHFLEDDPALVLTDRPVSTTSILGQWSRAVSQREWTGGHRVLVQRLQAALARDVGGNRERLLDRVQTRDIDGRPVTETYAQFMAGLDASVAGSFSRTLFADVTETHEPWQVRSTHLSDTDAEFSKSLVLTQVTGSFTPRDLAFVTAAAPTRVAWSRREGAGPAPEA